MAKNNCIFSKGMWDREDIENCRSMLAENKENQL